MSNSNSLHDLVQLYAPLSLPTAFFSRDVDGVWHFAWQNEAAQAVWGRFDLAEWPFFKLELMDAYTHAGPTQFYFDLGEPYCFTATPYQAGLIIQFLPHQPRPDHKEALAPSKVAEQNRFELALQATDFGLYDWDVENDFFVFNQATYDVLSLARGALGSSLATFLAQIHSKDQAKVEEAIEDYLERHWPLHVDFRVLNGQGYFQWVSMSAEAVWQGEKALRMAGTLSDISERKAVELLLREREKLIEQMIDALPMSIYIKDAQGCYRFFNKEAELRSGQLKSQLIGRTDYEIYPLNQAIDKAQVDLDVQKSQQMSMIETHLKSHDESQPVQWFLEGKTPMTVQVSEKQQETWLTSFALDITVRKQMEQALRQARNEAEAAAQSKANFLSVMSHEIRTPLNSVIGNATLLLSDQLSPELAQPVEMIKRSSEHLLVLINDILDFNKLEAGKVELEHSILSLTELVNTVVNMLQTEAQGKQNRLITHVSDKVLSHYKGDAGRLRQILLNLLGNAIKFTQQGEICLNITLAPTQTTFARNRHRLLFEVIDNGIGIAKHNIDKLFQDFSQAEASTSRQYGGSGLGLAICKKLVEAMQGDIGVHSIEGQGSTFWFEIELPSAEGEEPSTQNSQPIASQTLAILVAEDDMTNQSLIKTVLQRLGHQPTVVDNGKQVWQALSAPGAAYDLILMDQNMPEMGGEETTKKIRQAKQPFANIPIISLSGSTATEEQIKMQAVGVNDFLAKPLNIEHLKKLLWKWTD